MCGRFTLRMPVKELAPLFEAMEIPDAGPRYNIAPTQEILAIRQSTSDGNREFVRLRWGLIPSWAADMSIGNRAFNARSETAAEKPMFRAAIKTRRCAIVADGFFEWHREGKAKQPILFEMVDQKPFVLGGLWEKWIHEGQPMETCTILTTAANELLSTIHDRMPVIVPVHTLPSWLRPAPLSKTALDEYFRPFPAARMRSTPVNPRVNNPRNDDPDCIKPA